MLRTKFHQTQAMDMCGLLSQITLIELKWEVISAQTDNTVILSLDEMYKYMSILYTLCE